jgi:hypothetical protein
MAASQVAALDGVPAGVFAMVTDDAAEEFGLGRRVDLPPPEIRRTHCSGRDPRGPPSHAKIF